MSRLLKFYLIVLAIGVVLWPFDNNILDSIGSLARFLAVVLTIYYAVKFSRSLIRRFLWRIRRKLILSYILIGFIPVCLLMVLCLLALMIFMGQTTSEMFNSALDGYILQTKNHSERLLHLVQWVSPESAVEEWHKELHPDERVWLKSAQIIYVEGDETRVLQGGEEHKVPEWVKAKDFSGLILRGVSPWIAAVHHHAAKQRTVQILIPVNSTLMNQMKKKIDADIEYLPFASESARSQFKETVGNTEKQPIWPRWWDLPVWWLSLPDQYDWETGTKMSLIDYEEDGAKEKEEGAEDKETKKGSVLTLSDRESGIVVTTTQTDEDRATMGAFSVSTNVSRVYRHIFARSTALQKFVYAVMVAVAVFFLIIELFSFVFGFLLARSITASVHNLFEGTERIRSGDLSYRIKVSARDQLGDLAASFNQMTDSIQNLLVVRAEKERLAESLRIARQMQQNLLPREIASLGSIDIAAMNLPAQEVCGDYYDIIRTSDDEVGVIIADVSGKGPSAALYMAEAKGVILSISQRCLLPKQLLTEVNRILSPTLDSRSFITMTYASINEPNRIMRMSRAGHNPVLHYCAASGAIEVVQPRGIGLGLGRNGIFERTLEEIDRKLCGGDVVVFYTDGLTEAMNEQNQLYSLERLSEILRANIHLGTEQIKDAILADLQRFLNNRPPQDDVTLVLLKIR